MRAYYRKPRSLRRLAPRFPATAAVYQDDEQLAYGVVTNFSETGVCIVTDSSLAIGLDVDVKLSFYKSPSVIETAARVVWSRTASPREKTLEGLRLHGLKFLGTSKAHRERFEELLRTATFKTVYTPPDGAFDALTSDLGPELENLAAKIAKFTGNDPG